MPAVGATVALAITFYAGYQTGRQDVHRNDIGQAVVVTGLGLAARAKIAVAAFHAENGRFPTSNAEIGLPGGAPIDDRYVSGLAIGPKGLITVTYRGDPAIEGKTIVLVPVAIDDGAAINWSCSGGTVPAGLRPEPCR